MKKDDVRQLQISNFNYLLPDEKIAKYPLSRRDSSKLLLYDGSHITTHPFRDLSEDLPEGSLLLFNNTRVIHARLLFQKETGARIEIFCLSPHEPADYALCFQQRKQCAWYCMVGNAKRWKNEVLSMEIPFEGGVVTLKAEKSMKIDGDVVVHFSWNNAHLTFSEILELAGKLPVPPYLNRPAEPLDNETYQTVYSRFEGSVAAPTAGLHFTPEVMERICKKRIQTAEVTLHVGAGTFRPVKSGTIAGHDMHREFFSVSKETIEKLRTHTGKLIVVGTTSMRTVESLYYIGKNLLTRPDINPQELTVDQWEPYEEEQPVLPANALRAILDHLEKSGQERLISATRLMIAPGYNFHFPDALITNFHQPKSTLLLLVSAFIGEDWRKVYEYALQNGFRFLSYGDSSLLWKNPK